MAEQALVVVDYAQRTREANTTLRYYVLGSLGLGAAVNAFPIPSAFALWIDMGALTALNLTMLYNLSKHYDIPFSQDIVKETVSSLLVTALPIEGAQPLASELLRLIPGIGAWTSIISFSILSGAATYAIGKVFIQHFESGGTFLSFDPAQVRNYFMTQLEKGKQVVTEMGNV